MPKLDYDTMQDFIVRFTRELERWLADNSLTLVEPMQMMRTTDANPEEGEAFMIHGAVEHVISMEAMTFDVGFGERFGVYDPSDAHPTVLQVTDALTKAFWPGR